MILVLLIVTAATGALDAVGILHFHAFTAFVTGTIVLLGAEIVGQAQGAAKAIMHTLRRVGIVLALMFGAASGAMLAAWRLWAGLALSAALLALAGTLARQSGHQSEPAGNAAP